MKTLITGITGFVGSHLAEFLLEKGANPSVLNAYGEYPKSENVDIMRMLY